MMKRPSRAVILAAGAGSRLASTHEEPKPLLPVDGVPLALRTLDTLRQAGIRQVGLVIGHQGWRVRASVECFAPQGIELEFIENPRWREPNGVSLWTARDFTGEEDFILGMVDHVVDYRIVERLCALPPRPGVTLAVDLDVDRVFDLDDATRVSVEDGHIRSIGKQLPEFNGVDCGLFRCTAAVYGALEQAFAAGSFSVSGGMQVLAGGGLLHAMPVDGLFWQDVDTPEMLAEAERWCRQRRHLSQPAQAREAGRAGSRF
jgi:choline kinase